MRFLLLVLDGCGIGALPDASRYKSRGAATLQHVAKAAGGLSLPRLEEMGLGNIEEIKGVPATKQPKAAFGKLMQESPFIESSTGHWELAGFVRMQPFEFYPNGLPKELVDEFVKRSRMSGVLGNQQKSGPEITEEFLQEHLATGKPVVYTSFDSSTMQITAETGVIPVERQHELGRIAREVVLEKNLALSRVIVRPFELREGRVQRTKDRRDFLCAFPGRCLPDALIESGLEVSGFGRVSDFFKKKSQLSWWFEEKNDAMVVSELLKRLKKQENGLLFANLGDYDDVYGHNEDASGFAKALELFDRKWLPEILHAVKDDDVLVLTADHGNDPTDGEPVHTREHAPLLIFGNKIKPVSLGVRKSFADVGQSIAQAFGLPKLERGKSFWDAVRKK